MVYDKLYGMWVSHTLEEGGGYIHIVQIFAVQRWTLSMNRMKNGYWYCAFMEGRGCNVRGAVGRVSHGSMGYLGWPKHICLDFGPNQHFVLEELSEWQLLSFGQTLSFFFTLSTLQILVIMHFYLIPAYANTYSYIEKW